MTQMVNLYLRIPRKGWRNDGGPIPYRLRGRVSRAKPNSKTVTIKNPLQKVRVGYWIVDACGSLFAFAPADVKRLYGDVPSVNKK